MHGLRISTHTLLLLRLKSAGSRFKTTAYTSKIYIRTSRQRFFTQFLDKIMEDLELSEKQKPFVGQR